jgi:hypothetical protein
MAFGQSEILTLAGVLVILLAVIVYNNVQAMRARVKARAAARPPNDEPEGGDDLLLKFARHEGSVVGETVARDGDRLILKQSGTFKAVLAAQARVEAGEVVLTGAIDWPAAEAAGKAWHESRRHADEGVSGQLTRSEDVKAPALDATRRE